MKKPRYNPKSNIGVNVLDSIILKLKWIFRRQDRDDMGIDAHIEFVDDGTPTGRLIAVQIKTGKSYLKLKNYLNYFYFDNIHYQYWVNHSLPVLLVVHIPETNKTYWQFINKSTSRKSNKNWQVEIPQNHELNEFLELFLKESFQVFSDIPLENIITESSKLDSISENWSIDFIKNHNHIISTAVPKHPKAYEVEPLKQTFTFKSDYNIDGIPLSKLSQNPSLIKKTITFSKDMIESYFASEFLQKSLNLVEIPDFVKIFPLPKQKNLILLKFIDFQSREYFINNVEIEFEQEFDNKYILSNKIQNVPYYISFTKFKEKDDLDFQLTIQKGGFRLNDILNGFQFLTSLLTGGILSVIEMKTNKILIKKNIKSSKNKNENQFYFEILQKLKFIQEKFGLHIKIPNINLTNEEITNIQNIYFIISSSIVSCRDYEFLKIEVGLEKAIEILQNIDSFGSTSYYYLEENFKKNILENEIDLGKVHNYFESLVMETKEINYLREKTMNLEEKINITLLPSNSTFLYQIFENYFEIKKEINEAEMRKIVDSIPFKDL